jgi:dihydrofolate reductase
MMTNISLISAMTRDRVIGYHNLMPWHLPADLQHFKALTLGKPVIMGRKTFESIGKPLPNRQNIVLTRGGATGERETSRSPLQMAHSLEEAIKLAEPKAEIMIIGGAEIYRQCLPHAQIMYLTIIDAELEGDTWFPEWNPNNWIEIAREDHEPDEKNPYRYSFVTLDSRQPSSSD